MQVFILVAIIVCVIIVIICRQRRKEIERNIQENEEKVKAQITDFYSSFSVLSKEYVSNSAEWSFALSWKDSYTFISELHWPKKHPLFAAINSFLMDYTVLHEMVQKSNNAFIAAEKDRCKDMLSEIDGKSLDDQQRTVVVTDEDHNLVLAGAGSGKTLTIAGKVKYLCENKGVSPDDILLIAFTRKSAEEMTERIAKRLQIPIQATTFHKLGLDIITSTQSSRPDVVDNLEDFIKAYFENDLIKNPKAIRSLIEYFAYYLNLPADMEKFSSLGAAYEYEKAADFETIKSKYSKAQYTETETAAKTPSKISLLGEKVKSIEEVTIANFLFLNGIKYEYESLYKVPCKDTTRKATRPDFYLPDYDIYIEHFGINKNGRLPWLSPVEEKKYIEGIKWKRELHKENGTLLLETYSYYLSEGCLINKLEAMLKEHGIAFKEPDFYEIFNSIYQKSGEKYFSEFIRLCSTFIVLFKSNGYTPDALSTLQYKSDLYKTPFHLKRTQLFVDIVGPILDAYELQLRESNAIDFSDMINIATAYIEDGCNIQSYKYVIIDEFQDISVARYKLIKAILKRTKAKLLCVGDDWQSIYRFAGSDISLFTNFESYFGYTSILRIEQTYRNSQQLIDEVGRFITKNPMQLKKSLRSAKTLGCPLSFWFYEQNPFVVLQMMIEKLILDFGSTASIMLLGRTSYDFELLKESKLFTIKKTHNGHEIKYNASPETPISFFTIHKSKGLEADNVILLNFQNSTLGFPNKIADDPILELVLSSSDTFFYAEERRLFYVALTRTKNHTFVLTNQARPSEFLQDFDESQNVIFVQPGSNGKEDTILCPRCKTGKLTVRKNESSNKYFVGCSNYPQCEYTVNDTSIMNVGKCCPKCGGFLIIRPGKYGKFWGCSDYPTCDYTERM